MTKSNKIAMWILTPSLAILTLFAIFDKQPKQYTYFDTNPIKYVSHVEASNNKLIHDTHIGRIHVNAKMWSHLSKNQKELVAYGYATKFYGKNFDRPNNRYIEYMVLKTVVYDYLTSEKIEHFIWYF